MAEKLNRYAGSLQGTGKKQPAPKKIPAGSGGDTGHTNAKVRHAEAKARTTGGHIRHKAPH